MKAIKKILSNTLISLIIIGISNPLLAAAPACPTPMQLHGASLQITYAGHYAGSSVIYDVTGHINTYPQWKITPFDLVEHSYYGDDLVLQSVRNRLLYGPFLSVEKLSNAYQHLCVYHLDKGDINFGINREPHNTIILSAPNNSGS